MSEGVISGPGSTFPNKHISKSNVTVNHCRRRLPVSESRLQAGGRRGRPQGQRRRPRRPGRGATQWDRGSQHGARMSGRLRLRPQAARRPAAGPTVPVPVTSHGRTHCQGPGTVTVTMTRECTEPGAAAAAGPGPVPGSAPLLGRGPPGLGGKFTEVQVNVAPC